MKRIAWFNLRRITSDLYAPFVTVTLGLEGRTSARIDFLVDSGASQSIVPRGLVSRLLPTGDMPAEIVSSLRDASGQRLAGVELDLDITLANALRFPTTRERVLVGRKIEWPVLGMTWFEKVGVHFRNFPDAPRARQFALYPGPGAASRSGPRE